MNSKRNNYFHWKLLHLQLSLKIKGSSQIILIFIRKFQGFFKRKFNYRNCHEYKEPKTNTFGCSIAQRYSPTDTDKVLIV